MEIAPRAAYPEFIQSEGKTDGILADFPAKTLVFSPICGCRLRDLFSSLDLFRPIYTTKPATRNALDPGNEEASWIAR